MKSGKWVVLCDAVLVMLLLGAFGGCATKRVAMLDARSVPGRVSPGDDAVICVRVIDPESKVAAVTATVREYPTIVLDLNDNGQEGDEIAGDSVWSFAIEVPAGALAGVYNWDFQAYDANGELIKVSTDGEEEPLAAETAVEISY